MDKIFEHKKICNELSEMYEKKNKDYGNSFGDTFQKLGIISAISRILDKSNRICNLALKKNNEIEVKNESIEDTLKDLANYCIMTLVEIRNMNEVENETTKNELMKNELMKNEYSDSLKDDIERYIL